MIYIYIYINTLNELIDIRDGIKECNDFTKVEISRFILNALVSLYIDIHVYILPCFMFCVCFFFSFLLNCTFRILHIVCIILCE